MSDLSSAVKYVPTDFPELRKRVVEQRLFDKQPKYFLLQFASSLLLLGIGIVMLYAFEAWWVNLLTAVYLAFVFVQWGFLLHDSGHHQVFHSPKVNKAMAHFTALILGGSSSYWIAKHNEHHAHPNHEEMDPDVDVLILAFSEEQARAKKGISKWIVARQHWFFFPILSLVCISLRVSSVDYVLKHSFKKVWVDIALMIVHVTLYAGIVFTALPLGTGIAFVIIHQLLFGFYMGSVFAPNHKGMLMLNHDMKIDFLREQVLTSRNIASHPLTDFLYGGLNYQVEHHLFPHMPRNQLRKAHKLVKAFCAEKEIPYHETSILQSYREILESMQLISRFARDTREEVIQTDLRTQLQMVLTQAEEELQGFVVGRMDVSIAQADADATRLEELHAEALRRIQSMKAFVATASDDKRHQLQEHMAEVQQILARWKEEVQRRRALAAVAA